MGTSQPPMSCSCGIPYAKHNRDIDHLVEEHTHDGRVKLVQELHLQNSDDNEFRIECRKVQSRHFFIGLSRQEPDIVLVGREFFRPSWGTLPTVSTQAKGPRTSRDFATSEIARGENIHVKVGQGTPQWKQKAETRETLKET